MMKFLLKPILAVHSTLWNWNENDCQGSFHSSFRLTNKLFRWVRNNPDSLLCYGVGWWIGHEMSKSNEDKSSGLMDFIKVLISIVAITLILDMLLQVFAVLYVFITGFLPGAFIIRLLRIIGLWTNSPGEVGYGHCTINYIDDIWNEVRRERINRIMIFQLGY